MWPYIPTVTQKCLKVADALENGGEMDQFMTTGAGFFRARR